LRGKAAWYVPGADHAGFETWVVYEKALEAVGKTRFDYTRDELYAQVWEFVEKQRGNMELQIRALGASCDWGAFTFTLDDKVVRRVYKTFERMWREGMIYRGERLVNFCTVHQTAFADIEVVHREEAGTLWEIAYPYEGGEVVVATTRPETMLGDTAVAVNPRDERYAGLVGKEVEVPLAGRKVPVISDDYVDMEYGTGAVKITPAHDQNDFEVGERHGLPMITVIGFDGKMTDEAGGNYVGLSVAEAREKVLADLAELGLRRGEREIRHVVGHCYKCDSVIEPLLKEQWFVRVEELVRGAVGALEADKMRFFPASKKAVLMNYLKGFKDWNISRQIPWGIPIPMFRRVDGDVQNNRVGEAALGDDSISEMESQEWIFDTRVREAEITVDGKRYVRDEDTFDTWFSSSQWPYVVTAGRGREGFYPLSVMETGVDILFAWVARMVMMGVYVTGEVPFRDVYLHGLVLDGEGRKMSKSKGNVMNPMEVVGEYGSDAFRLGIMAARSAGMAQAFALGSVEAGRNLCNKVWNLARFIQGVVDEGDGGVDGGGVGDKDGGREMGEDWILREIDFCRREVERMLAEYRFAEAVELVYATIWDKYADWFVESQKIYRDSSLLSLSFEMILIMLHPFAPFLTETIWQNLSWTEGMIIHAEWPSRVVYDAVRAGMFEGLMDVVSEVRRVSAGLSGGKKWGLLYGQDAVVDENQVLVQYLARVDGVAHTDVPRGLRLAVANHEVYLDVPREVVEEHRMGLERRVAEVEREVGVLRGRLANRDYVRRAPAELVEETRRCLGEKEGLVGRFRGEIEVI
jgi:valyl-tRNA synthetase